MEEIIFEELNYKGLSWSGKFWLQLTKYNWGTTQLLKFITTRSEEIVCEPKIWALKLKYLENIGIPFF